MRLSSAGLICSAATVLACAACASVPAPSSVHIPAPRLVAEGRLVRYENAPDSLFGIPVQINNQPFLFVVDHAAEASLITDRAIDRLHLPHRYASATRVDTLRRHTAAPVSLDTTATFVREDGDLVIQYWGKLADIVLDSMRVGAADLRGVYFVDEFPFDEINPFEGIIGRDLLTNYDLEFDIPHAALRLYARTTSDTLGPHIAPQWLPPGVARGDCVSVPRKYGLLNAPTFDVDDTAGQHLFEQRLAHQENLLMPLTLDGREFVATFDSGSPMSIMSWSQAHALGLSRGGPNVGAIIQSGDTTYFAKAIDLRFNGRSLSHDTVWINDEKFRDLSNGPPTPRMLLGWQQFRDRTLFLSHSTGTVCVSAPTPH